MSIFFSGFRHVQFHILFCYFACYCFSVYGSCFHAVTAICLCLTRSGVVFFFVTKAEGSTVYKYISCCKMTCVVVCMMSCYLPHSYSI